MKKIMFNDKYGLTQAVLDGRKTQTRRIVDVSKLSKMQIDSLDDENSDLGILTMSNLLDDSRYKVGEEVAVAQSYFGCGTKWAREHIDIASDLIKRSGYRNKMFVSADLMPHRIKINNIRIERLQDISEHDALNEGLEWTHGIFYVNYNKQTGSRMNLGNDYRNAFATLIDKVSGKGTWESNPWVFVYDFELIR